MRHEGAHRVLSESWNRRQLCEKDIKVVQDLRDILRDLAV